MSAPEDNDFQPSGSRRGKAKKALKRAIAGTATAEQVALLSPVQLEAAMLAASVSITVKGNRQLQSGISGADLQMLVLSLLQQASVDHQWAEVKNKGALGCVVLLLVKGVTWSDWEGARSPALPAGAASSPLTFLASSTALQLHHRRGRSWNAALRVVEPLERTVLYLPENAVMMDGDASMPAVGAKRRREGEGAKEEGSGKRAKMAEEEEEDDGMTGTLLQRRVWSLALSLAELEAHSFPLAGLRPMAGSPPSSPFEHADDPPGCVAGVVGPLAHACTLHIPRGYMLTRTAHADLHHAFPAAPPCPLLAALPSLPATNGSIPTGGAGTGKEGEEDVEPPRLLAIDCEMCATDRGQQLARVSCVTESEDVAFDEYVLPTRPITDYVTRYSGITQALLTAHATLSADDVRAEVADLLDGIEVEEEEGAGAVSGTKGKVKAPLNPLNPAVAMGHSVENDLKAMRIIHTRVVDTSLTRAFAHPAGLPIRHALRHLSRTHLHRIIQGAASGHDSTEDALAVLHLIHTILMAPVRRERSAPASTAQPAVQDDAFDGVSNDLPPFSAYFSRAAREALLPVLQPEGAPAAQGRSGGGQRLSGVAGALGQLFPDAAAAWGSEPGEGGETASPAPAQAPRAAAAAASSRQPSRTPTPGPAKGSSILTLPDMADKKVVAGTKFIASQQFLHAHLAGVADGINVAAVSSSAGPEIADLRRVTDRVLAEAKRFVEARARAAVSSAGQAAVSGLPRGVGFVVAEVSVPGAAGGAKCPTLPGYIPDLRGLDAVLAGLRNHLPRGCLMLTATQAGRLRYAGGPGQAGGAAGGRLIGGKTAPLKAEDATAAAAARAGVLFISSAPPA